jgi:hypothetical protein
MNARRFLSATAVAGLVALAATFPVQARSKKASTKAGATAECMDGSYSHAKTQRGACSKHGGVKTWYGEAASTPATSAKTPASTAKTAPSTTAAAPEKPIVAAPAGAPQGATAKCKDGTYSHSKQHSGACSHHGGVAEWYQ